MSRRSSVSVSLAACAFFGACEVSRPEGAFDAADNGLTKPPVYDPDGATNREGDGQVVAPVSDAGLLDIVDGRIVGGGADGGGPVIDEQTQRLAQLSGLYFMRADVFTSAEESQFGITVTTRARASYYFLTSLGLRMSDLKLVGQERFCYLTAETTCKSSANCTLTTTIANQSIQLAQTKPVVERVYAIEGQNVIEAKSSLPLGYDLSPTDLSTFDPISLTTDSARVWNPIGDESVREGFFVLVNFKGSAFGVPSTFNCTAATVQRFDTSFEGKLAGTASAPALEGATLTLRSLESSNGKYLVLGGDSDTCKTLKADGEPPNTLSIAFARADLADTSVGQECPAISEWDVLVNPDAP